MWLAKSIIMYFFLKYSVSSESRENIIRLTKFQNGCPELNPIINFTEVIINKSAVNFKAYASEDAIGEQKIEIVIERCLSRDSPNTCEKFRSIKVPYFCKVWSMGVWAHFRSATSPEWQCPLKKGFIVTKRGIDPDIKDFSAISITGNYYWKVFSKIYTQGTAKLIICLKIEFETYFD